jgi:hypothetical protein
VHFARDDIALALLCFPLGRQSHHHGKIVVVLVVVFTRRLAFSHDGVIFTIRTLAITWVARVDVMSIVSRLPLAFLAATLLVTTTVIALQPRLIWRTRTALVALTALPVLAACTVPASRLIVAIAASVRQLAFAVTLCAPMLGAIVIVAIAAVVFVVSTIQLTPVTSSMLPELAARVACLVCLALLAKIACKPPFFTVAQAVKLGMLEHAVGLLLRKESLQIACQALERLGGQLFTALDVFCVVGVMVRHVVPLYRKLLAWR